MILCCVTYPTIFAHWKAAIETENPLHVKDFSTLLETLNTSSSMILLVHGEFFGETPLVSGILQLRTHAPRTRIMVLEDTPTFEEGKPLLRLGIFGYANARLSAAHLQQALMLIRDGNIWLYPEFLLQMIQGLPQTDSSDFLTQRLTKREYEIATLVAQGRSNKEIAKISFITEHTVKVHLRTIFEKLGIHDRLSLALMFR
ncbi:response regulator transcription factor [Sulfurospirillum sp. T05]|uniref:Response regulator transcription factor n=1 Tax=Sulfurospirillum tamanense TaxID=2813362 RepID=A0ABS2WU06_9BACT|nr:response regulator transcription factor [Sulfurospirillum tamanensis]MBN2965125.1 response regulator transcription factor [Sulfurospirillum tamanensis]